MPRRHQTHPRLTRAITLGATRALRIICLFASTVCSLLLRMTRGFSRHSEAMSKTRKAGSLRGAPSADAFSHQYRKGYVVYKYCCCRCLVSSRLSVRFPSTTPGLFPFSASCSFPQGLGAWRKSSSHSACGADRWGTGRMRAWAIHS